jgi:Uma2 family endonuclease
MADLLDQLGVPPSRILLHPTPGTATERDVIDMEGREDRLCELVDGTLVEKAMGYRESVLAMALVEFLRRFVRAADLGVVSGEAGMIRLLGRSVRIPDVAFISWSRLPGGRIPSEPIPDLVPDLAIEVLSASNTRAEMARKRREYFTAGVRLVWEIDPEHRKISVYADAENADLLGESDTLTAGDVLPGFSLPLAELFSELDRGPVR